MAEDAGVRMRINKRTFGQYYKVALKRLGSQRRVAAEVGVTHTLIGQILNRRSKTHVNLDTAIRFESVFGAPPQIIFLPEVLPITGSSTRKVVA